MAILPGTNVPDRIVPFDSNDSYATHLDVYGKGGYRVVESLTARDSITIERQTVNMLVYVSTENQLYKLVSTSLTLNNSNWQPVQLTVGGASLQVVAGEVITGQQAVYIDDLGTVRTASSDNVSLATKQIYISANSALTNDTVGLLAEGDTWTELGWTWIPGNSVYLGLSGVLTQTPPITGLQKVIASAVSSTKIKLISSPAIVLG